MKSVWPFLVSLVLVTQAYGAPREVVGQTGALGEWEITATVSARKVDGASIFVGPMTMTHVGICTQAGPERKSGELQLRMTDALTRVMGTLRMDGIECTFYGTRSSSFFEGSMSCPNRRSVPMTMSVK